MEEFDCIVLGAGSGLTVASQYANRGKQVAVVEPGPMGGTCLNRGCIPSKMLIHHADVAKTIKESEKFHIDSSFEGLDFSAITSEVSETVDEDAESIERGIKKSDNHTLYKTEGKFVDNKVIEVDEEKITADQIVIAAGTRPMVPPIEGLDEVDYITSKEALRLEEQPEELVIIGGGYIATELAHFYGSLGTDISIIEMGDSLVGREDREVSEKFTEMFSEKYDVNLGLKASKVEEEQDKIKVTAEDKEGNTKEFSGDELLVAAGRVPNTDNLKLEENTDIETDERGFVETDRTLETGVEGVYALGDIAGNWAFKHSANLEAEYVVRNALFDQEKEPDYTAMPHAIFSDPEVSGVGKTEQELEEEGAEYSVGKYPYKKTGRGMALKEEGFVKVLADPDGNILGCHIIGPHASSILHEVLVAMRHGSGKISDIKNTIHIHPALNEVVERAFRQV
ncbi:MAG: dihydrolipoyl dehydrogenase [Candidatus Nanohaloarchaea archaeon]|nr:dihydrolipoyl dehydrogenase [Candidatus Nanohaloarchaea archaeon]